MRVDIGRVASIYIYDGLYSDLDALPNRLWYEQADLALARVKVLPQSPGISNMTQLPAKKSYTALACLHMLGVYPCARSACLRCLVYREYPPVVPMIGIPARVCIRSVLCLECLPIACIQ